jgi:hypothetical protein
MNPLCSPISRRRSSGSENGDKKPKVPTLPHFDDQDQSIPLSDVASRCGRAPRSRKRGASPFKNT